MLDCLRALFSEGLNQNAVPYLRVCDVRNVDNSLRKSINLVNVPKSRRPEAPITPTLANKLSVYLAALEESGRVAAETALFPRFAACKDRAAKSAARALRRALKDTTKRDLKTEGIRNRLPESGDAKAVSRQFGISERQAKDVLNGTVQQGGRARRERKALEELNSRIDEFRALNPGASELPEDLLNIQNLPDRIKTQLQNSGIIRRSKGH